MKNSNLLDLIPIGSYGYGGYFAGIFENNLLIISPVKYEKRLNWNDAISYCELPHPSRGRLPASLKLSFRVSMQANQEEDKFSTGELLCSVGV